MSEPSLRPAPVEEHLSDLLFSRLPVGTVAAPVPERPRVERSGLVSSLVADLACCHLAFFCCNPGHGASSTAVETAYRLDGGSRRPVFLDLSGLAPSAQANVFDVVDDLLTGEGIDSEDDELALVFDGLHGLEEHHCARIARMVTRLVRRGTVLLLGSSECALLCDALPEHRLVGARDLLVLRSELPSWARGLDDEGTLRDLFVSTGGIPSLVEARVMASSPRDDPSRRCAAYRRRRAALLFDAVTCPLIDEERRLRCALVLLGSGSLEEVSALGVPLSAELVASTREECPVLGIDALGVRFSVAGSGPCPASCVDEVSWRYPDLVFEAVQRLVSRGALSQAIAIASRCVDSIDMLSVAAAFPTEILDAGGASLLRSTLAASASDGCDEHDLRRVRAVLEAAEAGGADLSEQTLGEGPVADQVQLLGRVRDLYAGGPALPWRCGGGGRGEGGVTSLVREATRSRLAAHLQARTHILSGAFGEALRVLAREEGRADGGSTLGGALLAVDSYVCARLLGKVVSLGEKVALADALAFLRTSAPEPWAVYEEALCWVADTACGSPAGCGGAMEVLATADGRGDGAVASLVRCGMALGELTRGELEGAVAHAHAALEGHGGPWVSRCCSLTVAVVSMLRGEEGGVGADWGGGSLGAAAEVVAYGLGDSRDAARERRIRSHLASQGCDAASALLVGAAVSHGREAADGLWRLLPETWRGAVRARRGWADRAASEGERPGVRVSVLGGLRVTVDGREVPPSSWRRGSAQLMGYLAVREGHRAYRHEVLPTFWPDRDQEACLQAFYQMTSAVRRAVGRAREGEPVVACRNGVVALSEPLVECDIDELRSALAEVFGPGSDEGRVDAALKAMALYSGGLRVPDTGPAAEFFAAERDRLECRYVDALVRGASLSAACSREHDGIVLAQAAHGLCPARDDAAACYVRMLMAAHRFSEAAQVCRDHAKTVEGVYGAPPSPELSALAREVDRRIRGLCQTVE